MTQKSFHPSEFPLLTEFSFGSGIPLCQQNFPLPTRITIHCLTREHDRSGKGKEYQNSGTTCKDKEEKEN